MDNIINIEKRKNKFDIIEDSPTDMRTMSECSDSDIVQLVPARSYVVSKSLKRLFFILIFIVILIVILFQTFKPVSLNNKAALTAESKESIVEPQTEPKREPCTKNYIVREYDSCSTIQETFKISAAEIVNMNDNLYCNNTLSQGQSICVSKQEQPPCNNIYPVFNYDTCEKIQAYLGPTKEELYMLNNDLDCSKVIDQGKQVCISNINLAAESKGGPCTKNYTVREYDSCSTIQETFKISAAEIVNMNDNLYCSNILSQGQTICVSKQEQHPCNNIYPVSNYDTCEKIQAHLGPTKEELHRLNNDLNCSRVFDQGEQVCVSFITLTAESKGGPCTKNYTVREYDSCSTIHEAFQISAADIVNMNDNLYCNNTLSQGRTICVSQQERPFCYINYTISKYDTCEKIRLRFKVSHEQLHRRNNDVDCSKAFDQGKKICLDDEDWIPKSTFGNETLIVRDKYLEDIMNIKININLKNDTDRMLVGISIGVHETERRHLMRTHQIFPYKNYNITFKFVIASPDDIYKESLQLENDIFGDIIILDTFEDSLYNGKMLKSYEFFKYVEANNLTYNYIAKMDSDCFLNMATFIQDFFTPPVQSSEDLTVISLAIKMGRLVWPQGGFECFSWKMMLLINRFYDFVPRSTLSSDFQIGYYLYDSQLKYHEIDFTDDRAYDFRKGSHPVTTTDIFPDTVRVHELKSNMDYVNIARCFNHDGVNMTHVEKLRELNWNTTNDT